MCRIFIVLCVVLNMAIFNVLCDQYILLVRLFKVNGQPIFIRGGNWILSDGLLRLSEKRYKTDIKFHADMNFNMIRCWGGGLAERPEFYHYCDIYGLLVSYDSLSVPLYSFFHCACLARFYWGRRLKRLVRFLVVKH